MADSLAMALARRDPYAPTVPMGLGSMRGNPAVGREDLPGIDMRPPGGWWPERMAQAAWGGLTLPGDVAAGRVDPWSDEGIGRAAELAGAVTLGSGALPAAANEARMGVRAYHATSAPFERYDFSRLGEVTTPNVAGTSVENWATNLARVGAWASDRPLAARTAQALDLPVEIAGKGRAYASLDALEQAVRRAGGPERFREESLAAGIGHIVVKDEEFGGTSYVALSPENFQVVPQPQVGGQVGMGGPPAAGVAPANEARMGIRAYHGSPYDFDKFDVGRVGSGTGLQGYGHGLYLTDNANVAGSYRDELIGRNILGTTPQTPAESELQNLLKDYQRDVGEFPTSHTVRYDIINDPDRSEELTTAYEALLARSPKGKIYETELNIEPGDLLNWNAPMSEQSPRVQAAIRSLLGDVPPSETGGQLYYSRLVNAGDEASASAALRGAGVPGIQHTDGDATNYVIFDDALIKLLRKYGIAGLTAGAGGAAALGGSPQPAEAAAPPDPLLRALMSPQPASQWGAPPPQPRPPQRDGFPALMARGLAG